MKKDFPIFANNPWLVFLDNAASTQKPSYVIDGVSQFVESSYANIHRGNYALSEKSEEMYYASKAKTAAHLACKGSEIIYTYNANYAINLLAQALCVSKLLQAGDVVLLSIWDHHANIVPRQSLAKIFGFSLQFMQIKRDYSIDREDFDKKYTDQVKVVACSQVSNVTGQIYDVAAIKRRLRPETFFLVDGSQALPNMSVNITEIGCDAYVATAHKILAYTGLGILYLAKDWIKQLTPLISGGGAIQEVDIDGFTPANSSYRFEAGTPNIIAAMSLLKAWEYIDNHGGMEYIRSHEEELIAYALERFAVLEKQGKLELVGTYELKDRVGVFSFVLPTVSNTAQIGEHFAAHNIAIRCGGHCAYPLHKHLAKAGTCRMSLYVYNDQEDIERFFSVLEDLVK